MKRLVYCPQLNAYTGSVTSTLLLVQLEHWFGLTKGQAFYKFLEPCGHASYRSGDSWTEELGFGKTEFRSAFSHIGKVYKSKSAYLKSTDKFEGKLYLSYYDRIRKMTFYIRNEGAISQLLRNAKVQLLSFKEKPRQSSYSEDQITPAPRTMETDTPPLSGEQVLTLFNTHCPSLKGTGKWTATTRKRFMDLVQQLKRKGESVEKRLKEAFQKVEASDYLCGRGHHPSWPNLLNWLLRPDKFFALLADRYAPFKSIPKQPTRPKPFTAFHLVESHHFDLTGLEAREQAFQQAQYDSKLHNLSPCPL
ncbi:MAG: hypothetical protein RR090_11995 [Niameybacter sp.]|uniref:hypothetical protein n=1 Tax=Niameybacter sp. TaxID=2033640 RepID=UPI002FC6B94C